VSREKKKEAEVKRNKKVRRKEENYESSQENRIRETRI
jgi:hypothetical protein